MWFKHTTNTVTWRTSTVVPYVTTCSSGEEAGRQGTVSHKADRTPSVGSVSGKASEKSLLVGVFSEEQCVLTYCPFFHCTPRPALATPPTPTNAIMPPSPSPRLTSATLLPACRTLVPAYHSLPTPPNPCSQPPISIACSYLCHLIACMPHLGPCIPQSALTAQPLLSPHHCHHATTSTASSCLRNLVACRLLPGPFIPQPALTTQTLYSAHHHHRLLFPTPPCCLPAAPWSPHTTTPPPASPPLTSATLLPAYRTLVPAYHSACTTAAQE